MCNQQVSEVLEKWIALQRTWMYLEPIFSRCAVGTMRGKFASQHPLTHLTTPSVRTSQTLIRIAVTTSCSSFP